MKSLALRIYLTVVAVLLVFALVSGLLAQHNMAHERHEVQSQAAWHERAAAWGELIENSLPPVAAPKDEQARALLDWAERLRMPMALDDVNGVRIATSDLLTERLQRNPEVRGHMQKTVLSDGRTLWVVRPGAMRPRMGQGDMGPPQPPPQAPRAQPWLTSVAWMMPGWLVHGAPALLLCLVVLFIAVALVAWPVSNRLTRQLQALRTGVEAFGSGQLQYRVAVEGRDEVAVLAQSFNEAAQRIEDLVQSNRDLLANASHELRSPLARLKMAVSIMGDMPPERAAQLKDEIHQDIAELDALVEEVLLASRLEARSGLAHEPVDLLGLVTEEASRVGAEVLVAEGGFTQPYQADDRLLRRAVRNLLENARRYGGSDIVLSLDETAGHIELSVSDRGPGVPHDQRERIFEPFYRLPGHAEHAGGVGLGLSLVRQIAKRHGGEVRCEARQGGGSRFVITLPA
ncbi:MAG: HAMP domain-containing sensor histidine kinase [Aquabacterium sp.]|nr:HAMP domain-containing sensor histidine kinase [Aquabacterium sp.]